MFLDRLVAVRDLGEGGTQPAIKQRPVRALKSELDTQPEKPYEQTRSESDYSTRSYDCVTS